MSLQVDGGVIYAKGHCRVEEAETLVGFLRAGEPAVLDVSDCEGLHAAVVQAILAFDCLVVGKPTDAFIRDLLAPALARDGKVEL